VLRRLTRVAAETREEPDGDTVIATMRGRYETFVTTT
jgi:hypothetical protein